MELYLSAFPDEDLLSLVDELLNEEDGISSLVAVHDQIVVGHILFTMCSIAEYPKKIALLGPLAVQPAF